ncbi:hypothetical protein HPB49_009354 [Dermacentor silvarum]|uniref:Uncharacterized protein n=1 Tax=Dermacentor silvarum TaxID=543639 RepID=A0ACB8DY22_DERSI|nr:hypothetical protein HPB49_009354 [Dermacentor silvarum]
MVVLNGEESELIFIEHVHQDELLQHTRNPCQALKTQPTLFNPAAMYRPDAYLVVYNVCSRSSLKIAKEYLSLIHRWDNVDHKAVIMVGNKTDLLLAGLLHQIRLKNQISYKDSCKRDSVRMRGRNSSCTSSFSGCKAKPARDRGPATISTSSERDAASSALVVFSLVAQRALPPWRLSETRACTETKTRQ